ncbi:hypothetical protein BBTM_02625 [Bifidobacterium bifidum]|nr:hypothetical protein BBTM_02625 [Bifidobacterium bifidum]
MPRFPTDSRRTIAAARHPTVPHLRTSTHGNTRPCMRKRHRSSLAHPRSGTARKRPPLSPGRDLRFGTSCGRSIACSPVDSPSPASLQLSATHHRQYHRRQWSWRFNRRSR